MPYHGNYCALPYPHPGIPVNYHNGLLAQTNTGGYIFNQQPCGYPVTSANVPMDVRGGALPYAPHMTGPVIGQHNFIPHGYHSQAAYAPVPNGWMRPYSMPLPNPNGYPNVHLTTTDGVQYGVTSEIHHVNAESADLNIGHDSHIDGKDVQSDTITEVAEMSDATTLIVRALPTKFDAEDICSIFRPFGHIKKVGLQEDSSQTPPVKRNNAFVE